MPEIDQSFLESLEREQEQRRRAAKTRKRLLALVATLAVLAVIGMGAFYLYEQSQETRALPPPPPPPSPQPTLPVSEKAKETGKGYYIDHPEIQSALAEYARQILKGDLHLQDLGPLFQPVANVTWEKWYYDTVPLREGFKTHKNPEPAPHPYSEPHAVITYTIQPDDKWGAWGVGIKYAAALGVDITNPADQEIASLVAAYVWLQSENRILYDKSNYFDEKGTFDPKRPKKNINLLRAGDAIRFSHLSPEMLKELAQSPQKYLEGTAPTLLAPGQPTVPVAPAPPAETPPPAPPPPAEPPTPPEQTTP